MLQKHRAVLHTDMNRLWSDYIRFPVETRDEAELDSDYWWLYHSPSMCPDYALDTKMANLQDVIRVELHKREKFALECDRCGTHDPRMFVTCDDHVICDYCESECNVDTDCMVDNYIID
jgi:hypothetical protein